jgi:hypothetical protein
MGIFLNIIKYVTLIPALIQGVEGLLQKGSDKKAAVEGSASAILSTLVSTGVIDSATAAKFPAPTSALIDAFVAFFNATGVFPSSSTK